MRALVCFVALALWSDVASAEIIPVRGGEHPNFTRLVLDVPSSVKWSVKEGDGLRVKLEGIRAEFDTSSATFKLNQNRVSSVSPTSNESELLIGLNCDCEVQSFLAGTNMLVIDIYDSSKNENILDTSEAEPKRRLSSDAPKPSLTETHVKLPLILPLRQTSNELSASHTGNSGEMHVGDGYEYEGQLRKAEMKLARALSRGASQGLLAARKNLAAHQAEVTVPPWVEDSQPPAGQDMPFGALGVHMRPTSKVDSGQLLSEVSYLLTSDGLQCMSDTKLEVMSWAGGGSFSDEIGDLRRRMIGEFDKTHPDVAIQLAKSYIYYGFGIEALQVLNGVELPASKEYIRALADLVEEGETARNLPEDWHLDCDSSAALWAALAMPDLADSSTVNEEAIERSFSALSPVLRAHLGPLLYKKLSLSSSTSEDFLKRLTALMGRGQTEAPPSVKILVASQALADGEKSAAFAILDELIENNDEDAPRALVKTVHALVDTRQAVPRKFQELLEAYVHEYRRGEIGLELRLADSLALISRGQFDTALKKLSVMLDVLSEQEMQRAASYFLEELIEGSTDAVFLSNVISLQAKQLPLTPIVENNAAIRLIKLGFEALAMNFLGAEFAENSSRSRRILRAQAALKLGKPRLAEVELLGLTGRDVEVVRAKARAKSDNHRGARLAYEMLGENELAAEQAWLGSEWGPLLSIKADTMIEEQNFLKGDVSQIDKPLEPLGNGRALLEESRGLRKDVETLLAHHRINEPLTLQEK